MAQAVSTLFRGVCIQIHPLPDLAVSRPLGAEEFSHKVDLALALQLPQLATQRFRVADNFIRRHTFEQKRKTLVELESFQRWVGVRRFESSAEGRAVLHHFELEVFQRLAVILIAAGELALARPNLDLIVGLVVLTVSDRLVGQQVARLVVGHLRRRVFRAGGFARGCALAGGNRALNPRRLDGVVKHDELDAASAGLAVFEQADEFDLSLFVDVTRHRDPVA